MGGHHSVLGWDYERGLFWAFIQLVASMSDQQQHDEMKSALTKMADEGSGLWEVETFTFDVHTLDDLLVKALGGDRWAGTTLAGMEGIYKRSATDSPMLCFACDTAFNESECPAFILRMLPKCNNPSMGAIEGICFKCAATVSDGAALSNMIVTSVRQHIAPDARVIHLHEGSGNV